MKNKEEIRKEIYELVKKISETNSEDALLETARELYEKSILLKHSSNSAPEIIIKQEEQTFIVSEGPIKPEPQPVITDSPLRIASAEPTPAERGSALAEQGKKQVTIDLFSSETVHTETPPASVPEKPAPKERKEPKKEQDESVGEKLQHKKITDLKASIGINEKFQFINELFEGNMKEYNVAVDQINSFSSHSEAESYIATLQQVYKWNPDNQIAENFRQLVERRFF